MALDGSLTMLHVFYYYYIIIIKILVRIIFQPTNLLLNQNSYVVELLGHGFQYGTPYTARFFPTRGSASTKLHALC